MNERVTRWVVNGVLAGAVFAGGTLMIGAVWLAWMRKPAPPAPVVAEAPPPVPVVPPVVAPRPVVVSPVPITVPEAPPPQVVVPPPAPVVRAEPVVVLPVVIRESDARAALAWVGKDPAAETVWVQAVNDTTNLSPNDRKNLIEDLNETGFDDPRNLTAADLPVIEYRLALIENLYDTAADDTNAAAFDEAYKDLLAMRARLAGP